MRPRRSPSSSSRSILALFTIVFAELVPKTLALANPERFALALSRPIDFLARVLGPLVARPDGHHPRGSRALFGADVTPRPQITAEELRLIVERGGEQGVLEAEEEQMINAVIELGERRVHEVMVPRIAIVALPASADVRGGDRPVVEEGHSRVPVYEEHRRDRRHPLRQGPAAVPEGPDRPAAGPPDAPPAAGVRARSR